jgi:integrase
VPRPPVAQLPDPLAQAFLSWCEHDRSESAHTLRRRRAVLRSLIATGAHPSTATVDQVEAWWLTRTHLEDGTRSNDLVLLRGFYRWASLFEHRLDDPTRRLQRPHAQQGAPKPVNGPDFQRILAGVADDAPARRAVLLCTWGGLRRAEAAGLDWPDIDPDTRVARVVGKGRKVRHVPFAQRLIDELLPDNGGNVITGTDVRWTADWVGRRTNRAIRAAGVDATMHKLRHRYGSIAYQRTKDPKALAELMGHASVDTTMRFYAAAADDAALAIADAVTE